MKRVIYSLYIDIPTKDIDLFDKNILKTGDTPMNIRTKQQFGYLVSCNRMRHQNYYYSPSKAKEVSQRI